MPNMRFWTRRVRQSKTCFLKKIGVSIAFAKNSSSKNFRPPKISAPVNYYLANSAKSKANGSYNCVCWQRALKSRSAVGMGDCRTCCKKKSEKLLFLTKIRPKKKLARNITTRHSVEWCPIDFLKDIIVCKVIVKMELKNIAFAH